jgi:ankyrin repeat protein
VKSTWQIIEFARSTFQAPKEAQQLWRRTKDLFELVEKIDSILEEKGEPSDEELKRIVQKELEAINRTLEKLARRCLHLGDTDDLSCAQITRSIYFALSPKSIQRFEHDLQIHISSAQLAFSVLELGERHDLGRQIKALRRTIEEAIDHTAQRSLPPSEEITERPSHSPVPVSDIEVCIDAGTSHVLDRSISSASRETQQTSEDEGSDTSLTLLTSEERRAWEELREEALHVTEIEKDVGAMNCIALIDTIIHHSLELFQQLLDEDVNIDGTDDRGYTALMHTVFQHGKSCEECVRCMTQLLRHKVDVNVINNGDTALHMSVRCSHLGAAKLLLENGARVDAFSPDTPLMLAVKRNQEAFVELFLTNRADVTVVDDANGCLVHHATWRNCVESLLILLEKNKTMDLNMNLDARCSVGWTPLMHLARHAQRPSNRYLAQILLDNGADVDATDLCGYTALYYAIVAGAKSSQRNDFIRLLLERGANLDTVRSEIPKHILGRLLALRRRPSI